MSRAWGWQASEAEATEHKDIVFVQDRPAAADPVPAGLDWDLWLGPAPARPFNNVYLPGPKWYRWWDFGNGTMSDLGSHWIDLPFWALKLHAPPTIEASGPPPHPEIAPASMQATYEYRPRATSPPVTLTWYQGTKKPDIWTRGEIPQWPSGVLFVGDKGMLLSDYGKHVLLPEEKFTDFTRPPPSIPKSIGHHAGVDPRVQDRRADDVPLRLLRLADRGEPPGQRRLSRRARSSSGTPRDARDQRAGGRAVPHARSSC